MKVTITELRKNVDKYLEIAEKEDVIITKYGKEKAKFSCANDRPLAFLDGLLSSININDEEIENIKFERIMNK